jgi:hypothetical protein
MACAKKHAAMLKAIAKARPDMQRALVRMADEGVIRAICECADNTLKGNVKLTTKQKLSWLGIKVRYDGWLNVERIGRRSDK